MTELRDELTRALRTVEAGNAPVEETMRLGRAIKTRRRAAVVVGALAVIAAVVGFPALAHHLAAPATVPAQHKDPKLTVTPPAPGAKAGTIAQGAIGTMRWQVGLRRDGPQVCLTTVGITAGTGAAESVQLSCETPVANSGAPADFSMVGEGSLYVQLGTVASNVVYFLVTFTDGQQLKLIPVTVFGQRYIAFAAPTGMPVTSIIAELGGAHFDSGQHATAIPFWLPGRAPEFVAWLRDGEPQPPRSTVQLGSGTVDGKPWQATAYQGPWGTCILTPTGGDCFNSIDNSKDFAVNHVMGWGYSPMVGFGSAAPDVAYLRITLSDGTVLPAVTPVKVGSLRLFAFAASHNIRPSRLAAYSASGAQLYAGPG
jgi:hypothetical protein